MPYNSSSKAATIPSRANLRIINDILLKLALLANDFPSNNYRCNIVPVTSSKATKLRYEILNLKKNQRRQKIMKLFATSCKTTALSS